MTTAQEVFDAAMALMDEIDENTGATDTPDTKEYKNKTLFILNILRGELYPFSDNFMQRREGKRPISVKIENFEDALPLDDYICQTVMPYGLAAHLLIDENPSTAGFCQQKYEELKAMLSQGLPAVSEAIIDLYDVIGYTEGARW